MCIYQSIYLFIFSMIVSVCPSMFVTFLSSLPYKYKLINQAVKLFILGHSVNSRVTSLLSRIHYNYYREGGKDNKTTAKNLYDLTRKSSKVDKAIAKKLLDSTQIRRQG